ncbi:hypothetical protein ADJ73_01995 [Arsenicicoccus sp. oral taxon 190]|nr:hypothetical protein ADJ73_01995 [Arsenicicoccus sp. oral taxon 190]
MGSRQQSGESLLLPTIAVAVAAVVYGLLPDPLLLLPRLLIPGIEGVLLVALVATHRWRTPALTRWSRVLSIVLSLIVIGTNLVALGLMVSSLGSDAPGPAMLLGAMQVWVTGIIGFALLYWELDRGGPVARHTWPREVVPLADWRFSQDENDDAVTEVADGASKKAAWMPHFIDYAYLSLTNSSAFSPTDTMPLSARAKALMGLQGTAALLTSLLVVARAVGSMSGGGG